MRRLIVSLSCLIWATSLSLVGPDAQATSFFSFSFDTTELHFQEWEGFDRVTMEGALSLGISGHPLLPAKFVQIAIPTESDVQSIEIISCQPDTLPGKYHLYPAQPYRSPSDSAAPFVPPDSVVYGLPSEYPGQLARVTNNGFLGLHHIAGVALYPLQYVPADSTLVLYTEIEIQLIFGSAEHSPLPVSGQSQETADFYSEMAGDMVINPGDVTGQGTGMPPRGEETDFLIITADSFVPIFERLADWKIRKGISTEIVPLAEAYTYGGLDPQAKIRECISWYYQNRGTKWVLLGGDTDTIPHRLAWGFGHEEESIPCDLYYSDLDRTWDHNGNWKYGEYPDEVDMYPEVFVGRAAVQNISEAQTFVNKCLTYETNPPHDYLTKILFAAERINSVVDGADLKDHIDDSDIVPDRFSIGKLYERDTNLTHCSFDSALNDGQHIINHAGHGEGIKIEIGHDDWWYGHDMHALDPTENYFLFYSVACYSARIDEECFAESTVNAPDRAAFAYIGNSRKGWFGTATEGSSPEYDIKFFETLFSEGGYQLGRTFAYSKIDFIPLSQDPPPLPLELFHGGFWRWTMFALLLLGDPTLELWTAEPEGLEVSHKSSIYLGEVYLSVYVEEDDVLVTCVKDGQLLGSAYSSGGIAVVNFDTLPDTAGTLHVTVTKPQHIPYRGTVEVKDAPIGARLVYNSHVITDYDSSDESDGWVNPGDEVHIKVTAKNLSSENTAPPTRAILSTTDSFITMIAEQDSFYQVPPGETVEQLGFFVFEVADDYLDSHWVEFRIKWTDGPLTAQDTCIPWQAPPHDPQPQPATQSWIDSLFQIVVKGTFTLGVIPDTVVVRKNDSNTTHIILTSVAGFHSEVQLSVEESIDGIDVTVEPGSVWPTDTSIATICAWPEAEVGYHLLCVSASEEAAAVGGIQRDIQLSIRVCPPLSDLSVWHVSTSGDDTCGNGTEDYPFRTIQRGIDAAESGDVVLVHRGAYRETVDFKGKPIEVTSEAKYDSSWWTVDSTIINADGSGPVVTFNSGETNSSILRGFTLINGTADTGAGIYCHNASPTILMNKLMVNTCTTAGSGIYYYNSEMSMPAIKIERTLIHHCYGTGAIYLDGGNAAQLINNTIANNGIGLYIDGGCAVSVKNSIFWGNHGCEIVLNNGSCAISYSDVDLADNEGYCGMQDSTGHNGNICLWPDFRDTTYVPGASGDTIGNYRFVNDTSDCIDAGEPGESIDVPWWGCSRMDMGAIEFPLEYIAGDVHFDKAVSYEDIRYLNTHLTHSDGCYPPPSADVNCDGVANDNDKLYLKNYLVSGGDPPVESCHYKCDDQIEQEPGAEDELAGRETANLPRTFSLSQNHPNPFNPDTKISFALPRDCHVKLTIYNVLGQKVITLVDEPKSAGRHEVIWPGKDEKGRDLASGIYFYRMEADEFNQVRKMLLLK